MPRFKRPVDRAEGDSSGFGSRDRLRSVPPVVNARVVVPGLNIPVVVLPLNVYCGAPGADVPGVAISGHVTLPPPAAPVLYVTQFAFWKNSNAFVFVL